MESLNQCGTQEVGNAAVETVSAHHFLVMNGGLCGLQETIRRRKQDFAKIEREIEADLAEEEEKEKRLKGREEEEEEDEEEEYENEDDEPDGEGKSERGGGSKNEAQVEHQKAGSNLHLKEHGK